MAKTHVKNNPVGDIVALIILLGIWLVSNIHYVIPIVIFIALILSGIKVVRARRGGKFGLTVYEATELRQTDRDIQDINSWFAELKKSGKYLNKDVEDRKTHKMRYSERSYLGREANQKEEERRNLRGRAYELRHDSLDSLKRLLLMWRLFVAAKGLAIGYSVTVFWSYLSNKHILNTDILHAAAIGFGLSLLSFLMTYGRTSDSVDNKLAALKELAKLATGGSVKPEYMLDNMDDQQSPDTEQKEEQKEEHSQSEQERRSRSSSESEDTKASRKTWYEVLGVSPNASADEIHAAWREKIKKTHPDRVADMDPELQALANQKAQEINMARDLGLSRFRRS